MNFFNLLALIMLFSTCKDASLQQKGKNWYHESLSFFGDSLVKHFPREFERGGYQTTVLFSTDTMVNCFKTHQMHFFEKYSDQEYLKIHSLVDSLSKAVYDAKDSTLLLVFDYQDKVRGVDGHLLDDVPTPLAKELVRRNKSMSKSLPVPMFRENIIAIDTSVSYSGFQDGFKLHVLGASSGLFLPGNKLSDSSVCLLCLPEGWEHGYSRGVALNDQTKEAIYWIVVW